MRNFLTIASILTVGFFFTACGGEDSSASKGFTKSGKAGSLDVTYSSPKPLVIGNNNISVKVTDHGEVVKNAKVELKIFMPEMPGMPYMEDIQSLSANGDIYNGTVNFSMGGTWQVKIFVEKDKKKYKYSSSVIL